MQITTRVFAALVGYGVAVAVLAGSLAVPDPARACPPPARLSALIRNAEAIVVASVRSVSLETRQYNQADPESAHEVATLTLAIDRKIRPALELPAEILLEEYGSSELEGTNLVGRRFLLLLERFESDRELFPTERFELESVADELALESMVAECESIERMEDGGAKLAAQTEWAIRCIEQPVTRALGIEEITQMQWSQDDESALEIAELAPDQKDRLVAVLTSLGEEERSNGIALGELLAPLRDPRVVDYARELVLSGGTDEWWDRHALALYASMFGWRTGEALADGVEQAEPEEAARLRARFLELMDTRPELPELVEELERRAEAQVELAPEEGEKIAEAPERSPA